MRRFCIDSLVLGTKRHIIGDSEGFIWSDSVPRDTWHMTGEIKANSSRCLDTLMKLAHHEPTKPPSIHAHIMSSLVPPGTPIPWQQVLPQDTFREFFKNLVQETIDVFSELPFVYYESAWMAATRVLSSLAPASVDDSLLLKHASEGGTNLPILESFRPKRSGFCHPVVYDRFATRTGRLTVSSGPNILVLKKTYRSMLKSSFEDGVVCSLDFRALEARIVLAEAGRSSDAEDMYDDIAESLFNRTIARDVVKTAVIAEMYGISRSSLKTRLGVSDAALDYFVGIIREHFKLEQLHKRLNEEAKATEQIINRFGRSLRVNSKQTNVFINTYAQSTGVDVAMLGFDSVIRQLGDDGIRPLFVLHDAVILDVRRDRIEDVEAMTSVSVPTYAVPFLLKYEKISV